MGWGSDCLDLEAEHSLVGGGQFQAGRFPHDGHVDVGSCPAQCHCPHAGHLFVYPSHEQDGTAPAGIEVRHHVQSLDHGNQGTLCVAGAPPVHPRPFHHGLGPGLARRRHRVEVGLPHHQWPPGGALQAGEYVVPSAGSDRLTERFHPGRVQVVEEGVGQLRFARPSVEGGVYRMDADELFQERADTAPVGGATEC